MTRLVRKVSGSRSKGKGNLEEARACTWTWMIYSLASLEGVVEAEVALEVVRASNSTLEEDKAVTISSRNSSCLLCLRSQK